MSIVVPLLAAKALPYAAQGAGTLIGSAFGKKGKKIGRSIGKAIGHALHFNRGGKVKRHKEWGARYAGGGKVRNPPNVHFARGGVVTSHKRRILASRK